VHTDGDRTHRPRAGRLDRGFTLIELLVVIAILALLVSILMPSLVQAKLLAKNVICQTNLKGVSTWATLYAQDHGEWLPHRGSPTDAQYWVELSSTDWYVKSQDEGLYKGLGTKSGTVFHCPQGVDSITPLRSSNSGNTYGLNCYLGGQKQFFGWEAPPPKMALLSAGAFWFADARAFASGGAWDFHSVLTISTAGVPSSNWPWTWEYPGRPDWQGHPGKRTNFVYGDGHVDSVDQDTFQSWTYRQIADFVAYPR